MRDLTYGWILCPTAACKTASCQAAAPCAARLVGSRLRDNLVRHLRGKLLEKTVGDFTDEVPPSGQSHHRMCLSRERQSSRCILTGWVLCGSLSNVIAVATFLVIVLLIGFQIMVILSGDMRCVLGAAGGNF